MKLTYNVAIMEFYYSRNAIKNRCDINLNRLNTQIFNSPNSCRLNIDGADLSASSLSSKHHMQLYKLSTQ